MELETLGGFTVCQDSNGTPLSLRRLPEEVVCLGFDTTRNQFAELHVVSESNPTARNRISSFLERSWDAKSLASAAFPHILASGEDSGLLFYATDLCEGEFLADYITRKGKVSPSLAFSLILELVEGLIEIEPRYRLLLGLSLNNLMIVLKDSVHLKLRVIDLGLAKPEPRGMNDFEMSDLLKAVSQQLFYLLTGHHNWYNQSGTELLPDSFPPDIQKFLSPSKIESLEDYHKVLKKCQKGIDSEVPVSLSTIGAEAVRPRLTLQREIFEKSGFETEIRNNFTFDMVPEHFTYPYSAIARDLHGSIGRLSWFPPEKTLPHLSVSDSSRGSEFRYRFSPGSHGLSLQELLILRKFSLSSMEIVLLMNSLAQTLDSEECEVPTFNFCQLWLPFRAAKTTKEIYQSAETEIEAWPEIRFQFLPATETVPLLQGNKVIKISKPNRLLLDFVNTCGELLGESHLELHAFLERSAGELVDGSSPYGSCADFLIDLADKMDEFEI